MCKAGILFGDSQQDTGPTCPCQMRRQALLAIYFMSSILVWRGLWSSHEGAAVVNETRLRPEEAASLTNHQLGRFAGTFGLLCTSSPGVDCELLKGSSLGVAVDLLHTVVGLRYGVDDCALRCMATAQCRGFGYNSRQSRCYLSSEGTFRTVKSGSLTSFFSRSDSAPRSSDGNVDRHPLRFTSWLQEAGISPEDVARANAAGGRGMIRSGSFLYLTCCPTEGDTSGLGPKGCQDAALVTLHDISGRLRAHAGRPWVNAVGKWPTWLVQRCSKSPLVFMNPRLDEPAMVELEEASTYYSSRSEAEIAREIDAMARMLPGDLDTAWTSLNKSSMLDFGTNLGWMLVAGKQLGFKEVVGVENAPSFAQRAEERCKCDVFLNMDDLMRDSAHLFDLITAYQVFEHVPNPVELGRTLFEALKPGGVLMISTPDYCPYRPLGSPSCADPWLQGPNPQGLFTFVHVCHYTGTSLSELLTPIGFQHETTYAGKNEQLGIYMRNTVLRRPLS